MCGLNRSPLGALWRVLGGCFCVYAASLFWCFEFLTVLREKKTSVKYLVGELALNVLQVLFDTKCPQPAV